MRASLAEAGIVSQRVEVHPGTREFEPPAGAIVLEFSTAFRFLSSLRRAGFLTLGRLNARARVADPMREGQAPEPWVEGEFG